MKVDWFDTLVGAFVSGGGVALLSALFKTKPDIRQTEASTEHLHVVAAGEVVVMQRDYMKELDARLDRADQKAEIAERKVEALSREVDELRRENAALRAELASFRAAG